MIGESFSKTFVVLETTLSFRMLLKPCFVKRRSLRTALAIMSAKKQ